MLDFTVIIPVRNAENFVDDCLASIVTTQPSRIIVVDGLSTDRTLEIVKKYVDEGHPIEIFQDNGTGVPAARMLGIRAAISDVIALVDVDIVFPEGTLAALYQEFIDEQYDGLQAGLHSEAGPGYWGQALVFHHNTGRSKSWPGVMCTFFRRRVLLDYPFDERFRSGEDIELRWRLQHAGLKLGVSHKTIVRHRYGDTFEFAKDQWLQDGKGLGRMFAKYRWSATKLLAIPLAGCIRGIFISLMRLAPKWIPYYLAYLFYNYQAMPAGMQEDLR